MIYQQLTPERFGFVWRFSGAARFVSSISLPTGHCFRATDHHSPVPRFTPGPAGSGCETLPRWLLPDTDTRFVKDRTGSDLDERSVYTQYVTEPSDSCGKINLFLPTRCRPTVEHSLAAGDAQRQWLQAACQMAISRNACSLPDFPEFAQAVRYGVLASGKLWKGGRDLNSETFR